MDLQNILGAHNDTLNFLVFTKNQKKTQKIQEKTLFLDYITQHRFLSVLVNHTTPKLFFSKSRKSQLSNDVFKIVMRPLEKVLFHFSWKKISKCISVTFPLASVGSLFWQFIYVVLSLKIFLFTRLSKCIDGFSGSMFSLEQN